MDLSAQVLQFLVKLPEVDSPDKRKALIMLTGLSPLAIYLDWQGSNMEFFPRLIEEVCRRGQESLTGFLQMLSGAPQVQGQERQEIVLQLGQAVEALNDSEWQRQFAVSQSAQSATQPLDVDMLATAIISTVLTPYFKLGVDGLKSAGAVQLAQGMYKRLREAFTNDGGTLALLSAFEQNPDPIQELLLPLVHGRLAADETLAKELAALLENAEKEDGSALRTIINVAQKVGTVRGSLVGAILGADALPQVGQVDVDQTIDTVGEGGGVVGAVVGNSGPVNVGGQHHHETVNKESNVFNQSGQNVQGNQTNVAGNVAHMGDRHEQNVRTDGGAYIGGNVSTKGDFVGRDKVIHGDEVRGDKFGGDKIDGDKIDGDKINVGNISGSSGVAIGRGASASVSYGDRSQDMSKIAQIFESFYAQIAQSSQPTALQAIIQQQVQVIAAEAHKGGQANEQIVENAFIVLTSMAPDLCNYIATTLATPAQGLPATVQVVARRIKG